MKLRKELRFGLSVNQKKNRSATRSEQANQAIVSFGSHFMDLELWLVTIQTRSTSAQATP